MKPVLYTRRGCGLCEDLAAELETPLARHGLSLELRDVDADPELRERFGLRVPVLCLDGSVIAEGRVDPSDALEALLNGS